MKLLIYTVYRVHMKDDTFCNVALRHPDDYEKRVLAFKTNDNYKLLFRLSYLTNENNRFKRNSDGTVEYVSDSVLAYEEKKRRRRINRPDKRFKYGTILMVEPNTGDICESFNDRGQLMEAKGISKVYLSKYLKSSETNPTDRSHWRKWKDKTTGLKYCFIIAEQYNKETNID